MKNYICRARLYKLCLHNPSCASGQFHEYEGKFCMSNCPMDIEGINLTDTNCVNMDDLPIEELLDI
jgi:hypothetical protein